MTLKYPLSIRCIIRLVVRLDLEWSLISSWLGLPARKGHCIRNKKKRNKKGASFSDLFVDKIFLQGFLCEIYGSLSRAATPSPSVLLNLC